MFIAGLFTGILLTLIAIITGLFIGKKHILDNAIRKLTQESGQLIEKPTGNIALIEKFKSNNEDIRLETYE